MSPATLEAVRIGGVESLEGRACIRLAAPYASGLRGLSAFSHALVVYWCDRARRPGAGDLILSRPYASGPSELGTFSTRTPERPNPIAVSAVRLEAVDVERGVVWISFIDALPGSPVLDLKPYVPALDRVRDPVPPDWCRHWPDCFEDAPSFDWASEIVAGR